MQKILSAVSLSHLIAFRSIAFKDSIHTTSQAYCQSFKCIENDYEMKSVSVAFVTLSSSNELNTTFASFLPALLYFWSMTPRH